MERVMPENKGSSCLLRESEPFSVPKKRAFRDSNSAEVSPGEQRKENLQALVCVP
jgi:hypothetical protein